MTERWNVKTSDGGAIAVWIEGDGPPLVLVHGSISDHTAFDPLAGELRGDFTVFAMDRRGFGASPDSLGYSAEREFSDVAAVVDAVAARTGEPVVLFGHSWGASCALGAAPRLPSLRALVLYEPSLGLRYPPGSLDRIEARIAAGDHESAVIEMFTSIAGLTEAEVAELQAAPNWPERVAAAPTIAREGRIEEGWDWQPDRFAGIGVPHPAHHRFRNDSGPCGGHVVDRRSHPRCPSPRARRPRPRRHPVGASGRRRGAASLAEVTGTITWAGHLTRRSPLRASSKSPQQIALGGLDGRERHLGRPGPSARPAGRFARCLPALIMLDGGLRDNRTADTPDGPFGTVDPREA
jgi:pimeloyl-ACP methyl ester carboxylesterase